MLAGFYALQLALQRLGKKSRLGLKQNSVMTSAYDVYLERGQMVYSLLALKIRFRFTAKTSWEVNLFFLPLFGEFSSTDGGSNELIIA